MLYQWLLFTIKLIHLLLPFAAAVQNKTSNNTQQQQQQPEYIYGCFDRSSVPLSTTNQINLNNLISSLTSDAATSNGFGHTTSGSSNADQNMFYGLYVCRGDVNKPLCHSCIQTYSRLLMQFCPNSTSALMIYPLCGVRYSNQNFFGILTVTPRVPMFDIKHNVSRAGRFDNDSRILMTRLIETGSETPLMFATHMFKKKGTQTRYGWVQCNRDITRVECRTCLSSMLQEAENCCVDKVMWRVFSPSCIMMYETQPFFLNEIETLQPTLEPHPQAKEEGNKTRSWIITVTIIAVTVIVVIALLAFGTYQFGWLNWKNDKKGMKEDGLNSIFWEDKTDDKEDTMNADLPMIPLDTILTITNNFSDEYKLGKGGFGSVYKGVLPDGRQIAIKRLAKTSVQGVKEFKNEVMLIARLQHRNLVRLLAFCIEKNEKLLVYEYMPNSSLDFHLFDREKGAELDWKQRSNIINGIAKGLLYLHEDSRLRIIHRDLKAGNVLLDQEMNPKISDFGLARIFGGDQREAINTNRVVGTYGYMAPEYAMEGLFSVKSDVFSFGVLLLEIISGKRINQFNLAEHGESLLIYAWNLWCEGKGLELMDPLIEKSCVHSEVLKCMHIGLLCVQEDAAVRPTMSSVVHMLGSDNVTLPCPVRPAFSVGRVVIERALSSNNWGHSINELTISDVTPR